MAMSQVDDVAFGQCQVIGPGGLVVVQHHNWTDKEVKSHCAGERLTLTLMYLCPGSGEGPWLHHPQGAVERPCCRHKLQSHPTEVEEAELESPDLMVAEEIFCEMLE